MFANNIELRPDVQCLVRELCKSLGGIAFYPSPIQDTLDAFRLWPYAKKNPMHIPKDVFDPLTLPELCRADVLADILSGPSGPSINDQEYHRYNKTHYHLEVCFNLFEELAISLRKLINETSQLNGIGEIFTQFRNRDITSFAALYRNYKQQSQLCERITYGCRLLNADSATGIGTYSNHICVGVIGSIPKFADFCLPMRLFLTRDRQQLECIQKVLQYYDTCYRLQLARSLSPDTRRVYDLAIEYEERAREATELVQQMLNVPLIEHSS